MGSLTSSQDPFYYYEETRHGQKKKRKGSDYRAPGVSERDNKVLASVRKRAWRLDMGLMNCCGFRFGWSGDIRNRSYVSESRLFSMTVR